VETDILRFLARDSTSGGACQFFRIVDYTFEEGTCTMPVLWTKYWGNGLVFYSALGHDPAEFDRYPAVFQMSLNGIPWAGNAL
jgi:type 1 glutamine amidotransferase